jgi:LysM repeat protein
MLGITRVTVCGLLVGACAAVTTPALTAFAASPAGTYTVVRGDSLSRIAFRNHTTVAQLVALNKGRHPSLARNANLIYAGWVLTLGAPVAPPAPPAPPAPVAQPAPPAPPAATGTTYTVVRGDSLSRIAFRNHTTVAQLVALNKGRYPSLVKRPGLIRVGWVLTIH